MEIRQITEDKDNYLEMLLIADPQENMIRRYLDKSDMSVSYTHLDVYKRQL